MSEPFKYPSRILDCDCVVCTRAGVNTETFKEPNAVFQAFKLVKVDAQGNTVDLTDYEFQEFESKYPKHSEWLHNSNVKNTSWHKVCVKLLKNLMRDKDVKQFKDPVDPVRYYYYMF